MELTRRNFLESIGILGAGAAVASLAGCSQPASSAESSNGAANAESAADAIGVTIPKNIDETIDCDIVVVGGGISGLAAAVQAAGDGLNVVMLEKTGALGSMGGSVEGTLGVQSKMQLAAGIDFTIADVVAHEMEVAQYRSPGAQWIELCANSAGNIDWALENGVEFESVDDYYGTCTLATFHWFKNHKASDGYITPMSKRAQTLGVDCRVNTAATALVIADNGTVQGVYAKDQSKTYRIDARAVILASGGVGGDPALIKEQGWTSENLMFAGNAASNGDGLRMALQAGGKNILPETCAFIMNYVPALPSNNAPQYADPINGMVTGVASCRGLGLWVNQDAKRFVNETIGFDNMMLQTMPTRANKASYVIFTESMYRDTYVPLVPEAMSILEDSVKTNDERSLFKSDDIAGLARAVGLDAERLEGTVSRYNSMCTAGKDTDFMRKAEHLRIIDTGPFYIARIEQTYFTSIGGILNSAKQEALTPEHDVIPGLYVAGLDGAMLYRNVYTINLGGSCSANNINTGRYAAIHAKEYIDAL